MDDWFHELIEIEIILHLFTHVMETMIVIGYGQRVGKEHGHLRLDS